jgi:hypothetical protein
MIYYNVLSTCCYVMWCGFMLWREWVLKVEVVGPMGDTYMVLRWERCAYQVVGSWAEWSATGVNPTIRLSSYLCSPIAHRLMSLRRVVLDIVGRLRWRVLVCEQLQRPLIVKSEALVSTCGLSERTGTVFSGFVGTGFHLLVQLLCNLFFVWLPLSLTRVVAWALVLHCSIPDRSVQPLEVVVGMW